MSAYKQAIRMGRLLSELAHADLEFPFDAVIERLEGVLDGK